MATPGDLSVKEMLLGVDSTVEEEYASQSKLLREFTDIPNIDKAWIFKSDEDNASQAMFSISQTNLLANKKRTHILSSHISTKSNDSMSFQWAPFPVEITSASAIIPSPSGSKLLVIKNQENDSPTLFEIWGPSQLQKEIHVPKSVHGSVFADGWFEGISWDSNETLIAYVAEEQSPAKPTFDDLGYLKEGSPKKDCGSWKGQGDWEDDWGETYSGKRQPALFVIDVVSGSVHGVKGISKSLSVGQVIWAPTTKSSHRYLIFVGWSLDFGSRQAVRKLGIKYCYNRPCALYAVRVPLAESVVDVQKDKGDSSEDLAALVKLTEGISSAFFPRFSPDGRSLVFLSARSAVDTGAHWATNSLHRIDWPADGNPQSAINAVDVVPVTMSADDGCFPGLYSSNFISEPWLSDGRTMIFSSIWRSTQVILSVDVLSGNVTRISPADSLSSWDVLALDGDKILSVSSSPIEPPQIKYGVPVGHTSVQSRLWNWLNVPNPIKNPEKVCSLLASLQFSVLKIPIGEAPENLTKGKELPFSSALHPC
ncbi:hypothetical protein Scep_030069 [Stephania cephalantha]|uniref:Acylamino-acid-releasing enzyme N-terminal domain-containing protein n=1 Tax=Stephania cephalantha TaxID=152367 RepID=A0AAP0E267_9MAGN